jgi:hypothetical protein
MVVLTMVLHAIMAIQDIIRLAIMAITMVLRAIMAITMVLRAIMAITMVLHVIMAITIILHVNMDTLRGILVAPKAMTNGNMARKKDMVKNMVTDITMINFGMWISDCGMDYL